MEATKNLSRGSSSNQWIDWEGNPPKDYDPEDDVVNDDDDNDEDESGSAGERGDEPAGTEHYVAVGTSELRQKQALSLGPEYRGSRVSRAALEAVNDHDENDEDDDDDDDDEGLEDYGAKDNGGRSRHEPGNDMGSGSGSGGGARLDPKIDEDDDVSEKEGKAPSLSKDTKVNSDGHRARRARAADFMSDSTSDAEDAKFVDVSAEESENGSEGEGRMGHTMTDDDEEEAESENEEDRRFIVDDDEQGDESEDGMEEGGMEVLGDEHVEKDKSQHDEEESESDEDDEDDDDDDDDDDDGDDDDDDDDSDDEDEETENDRGQAAQRAELRRIMHEGQKSVMATMSEAAKADANKGLAVRAQRRIFDAILNLRIRLQKALVAANTFHLVTHPDASTPPPDDEAYQAAEQAALKLWTTVDSVRTSLCPESVRAKLGSKRKRDDEEEGEDVTTASLWAHMAASEAAVLPHRRRVLDKWSAKVRSSTAAVTTRKLGSGPTLQQQQQQSLAAVLDDQLVGGGLDRLVKRVHTPRSCAPAQAARRAAEDARVYDDADFYQLLLKELVDQRGGAGTGAGGAPQVVVGAGSASGGARLAMREAKTRKDVDRRASKGRKLRYTVHEKLQNFAAPDDRRSWEQQAIDQLFGALFGQRMALGEGEEEGAEEGGVEGEEQEDDDGDHEMGGTSPEEAGLRLLRG